MKRITFLLWMLLASASFLLAQPGTGAPDPTTGSADVISIFSGSYTDLAGTNFNPGWGQTTVVTTEDISGNSTLKYANLNYQGTQLSGAQDFSSMEFLHIDVWSATAGSVRILPISISTGEKPDTLTLVENVWNSFKIPLSEFTSQGLSFTDIHQFKIDNPTGTTTIYIDNIYFSKTPPAAGTDATLSDLKVDGVTITNFNASTINYTVGLVEGTTTVPTVTATENDVNANAVITPASAVPGTTIIVVTAQDGTTTKTYNVVFAITAPSSAATNPPARAAVDVISIFSDTYTNVTSTNFNPNWGQSTQVTTEDFSGNEVLKYANFNYQGTVLGSTQDVSLMEYLHVDMWTNDATLVKLFPISVTTGEKCDTLKPITAGVWNSYDIPLTKFTSQGLSMADIKELKFDGQAGVNPSNIYLDNIYFYKAPAPAGTDATLSDLKVDGTTIAGFSANTLNYTVGLVEGTSTVPTITVTENDANANAVITAASTIPGTTTIVVTAQDGTTTKTYNVTFAITIPAGAASTPPVRETVDVISIFSGAYTNVTGTDFNPNWGQSTVVTTEDLSGNATLKYANLNYQGTNFGSNQDASLMEYLHVDVWNANAADLSIFCISSGPVEKGYALTGAQGEWVAYNIPISEFSDVVDMADVFQFKVTGTAGSTVYIDNLYFYKAPTPIGSDATLSDLKVDGTTITSFSTNTLNYTVGLVEGTTSIPAITVTENDANANTIITAASAIPGTTTIVVTAQDGTTTKTYTVAFNITSPAAGAPVPESREAADVVSVYSDAYTNVAGTDFNPAWGQSTVVSTVDFSGNATLKYANLNYQGTTLATSIDVSTMEYMHIDVWNADADEVSVFCISNGPLEKAYALTVAKGSWQSFNIALSEFSDVVNMADIFQLKIVGTTGSTLFIDNIYFYKEPVVLGTEASLNALTAGGVDVTDFESGTLSYSIELPYGTSIVPVVSATAIDAAASVVVTPASALPGITTIVVTAEDGTTVLTYSINFTLALPNTEARLSDLRIDGLTLLDFANDTLTYAIELPFGTTAIPVVSATQIDTSSTIVITQTAALPGSATVEVTAQDGTTVKTYTIAFTVAQFISDDAKLRNLMVNGVDISNFAFDSLAYTVELPYGTVVVPEVSAITKNTAASTVVTQATALPGTASVVVTAQDGTTQLTYTVAFTVAQPSSNAGLSNLLVNGISISGFSTETLNYNVVLPVSTINVPVVSLVLSNLTSSYILTQATEITDTVIVIVTAENGTTTKTYTITFSISPTYNVAFNIVDASLNALADAQVVFILDTLVTDINGVVEFTAVSPTTDASYKVTKTGYVDATGTCSVVDTNVVVNVSLELKTYSVNFFVIDAAQNPLSEAKVSFQGDTLFTDANGKLTFDSIPPVNTANYTISKAGFMELYGALSVIDADVDQTVTLQIQTYSVRFTVVNSSEVLLAGAEVVFMLDTLQTDMNGFVEFSSVSPTTDAVYTVKKSGYVDVEGILSIVDSSVDLKVTLQEVSYEVTFTVLDKNELALADAEVVFNEITMTTDANGLAIFSSVSPVVDAAYTITKEGYIEASGLLSVVDADVELTVQLLSVGVQDKSILVSNIYPNPTKDVITIQLASDVSEASVELFDLNGRMVLKKSLFRTETTLDLSENNAGIYLIKIVTEHNQFNGKIVLSK